MNKEATKYPGYAPERGADGGIIIPLCNFIARAIEDVVKDNVAEESRFFTTERALSDGRILPNVQVTVSTFCSLAWVADRWDMRAVIGAHFVN